MTKQVLCPIAGCHLVLDYDEPTGRVTYWHDFEPMKRLVLDGSLRGVSGYMASMDWALKQHGYPTPKWRMPDGMLKSASPFGDQ